MPYGEYAKCPHCNKTAYGKENIKREFGYRNTGKDKVIPQSYCRKCRSDCQKKKVLVLIREAS